MEDILAITFIFGGGSLFLLAISPVGRAIADRIRRSGGEVSSRTVEQLKDSHVAILEELEAVRQEVVEIQERLDFTERMLAQQRDARQLPHGGEVGQ